MENKRRFYSLDPYKNLVLMENGYPDPDYAIQFETNDMKIILRAIKEQIFDSFKLTSSNKSKYVRKVLEAYAKTKEMCFNSEKVSFSTQYSYVCEYITFCISLKFVDMVPNTFHTPILSSNPIETFSYYIKTLIVIIFFKDLEDMALNISNEGVNKIASARLKMKK